MPQIFEILEIVLKLVLAAFLGGVIGYQREISEKPAGLRTHVLVSLGSALLMIISIEPFFGIEFADVTRIAASVVTGIGFLGAGAIIRQGSIVRGLTTAASLWVVSGVGLAVGAGLYAASLISTLLVFVTLVGLKYIEVRAVPGHRTVQVTALDNPQQLGKIISALGELGITVRTIEIESLEAEGTNIVQLSLQIPPYVEYNQIVSKLASVEGVGDIRWITRGMMT
ncbi:MAG: MgtC/SapB family protein [Actinobacteria bacterium]|nr:MgtC/SapB family protein [Actinomycetota bacterium]